MRELNKCLPIYQFSQRKFLEDICNFKYKVRQKIWAEKAKKWIHPGWMKTCLGVSSKLRLTFHFNIWKIVLIDREIGYICFLSYCSKKKGRTWILTRKEYVVKEKRGYKEILQNIDLIDTCLTPKTIFLTTRLQWHLPV